MGLRTSLNFGSVIFCLCALCACPKQDAAQSSADAKLASPAATAEPAATSGESAPENAASQVVIPAGLTESSFSVEGMHCADCSSSIEKAVIALPGVSTVAADWKSGQVKVQYDATKCKAEDIIAAVDKLKFSCKLADAPQEPAAAGAQGA